MLPPAPVIAQTSISEQTYVYLRDAILKGHLAPGQRLHMHHVSAKLGVSKMPVKEAVARLEAEGLVEIRPRSGTYVARLDPTEVAETWEIRGALEVLAGELAVLRVTDDEVAALRVLLDELEQTGAQGEVQRHVDKNFELHGRIVELSGNRRLLALYRQLRAATQVAALHHRWQDWTARLGEERAEHLAIVDALALRDRAAVSGAISHHIARGKVEVLAGLAQLAARETAGAGGASDI